MKYFDPLRSWVPVLGLGRKRDLKTIKLLLKRSTDATASDSECWTLLHYAAKFNNLRAAKLLIKAGAHLSAATNRFGSTPLHFAQRSKMVQLLLDAGADPLAKDSDGDTPFDNAVMWGPSALINTLLQAEAVNVTGQPGVRPALYQPMRRGEVDLVIKLIELGASPWHGCTYEDMPWYDATGSCRRAAIAHLFKTAHDDKASHENTPEGFVRQLVLGDMCNYDGKLTEDDFPAIARLIDEELRIHYPPPRSPPDATTSQALDGGRPRQTDDEMQSPCDGATKTHKPPEFKVSWASEEEEEAYNLQCNFSRLLAAISAFITALLNNSNNNFQGGMEFMKRKRPPCLSMPWTIWPALVVLWGVCWMFINSPVPEDLSWLFSGGNDGSTSELDNPGFWNGVTAEQLSLLDPDIGGDAQGSGIDHVFPSMLAARDSPDVAAQVPDFTYSNWGVRSVAPQDTGQPQGSSHNPQLAQIAPSAWGMTANVDAITVFSSEAVQRQKTFQCDSCPLTFGRRTTLQRHQREKHGSPGMRYFCPRLGCKRSVNGQGFVRKEQLARHRRDSKCCRSDSASRLAIVRPAGSATEQLHEQQPSDDDMHSFQGFSPSTSPLDSPSSIPETSDAVTYTQRLLRTRLATLEDEEQECEAEEREMMAEIAARKKRILDEKKQAQAALDALDRSPC